MPVLLILMVPYATPASISGSNSVGEKLFGNYSFNDSNGDSEGASSFRWLSADSLSGNYQAISGATNLTYILTNDDLGRFIKFEVTPISIVAPTVGLPVLSSATNRIDSASYLNHILSTGQSLSTGEGGTPVLTTSQPYQNEMLSGTSLVPLVESGVETISSSMANFITSETENSNYQVAVTRHGVGGTGYGGLKKGRYHMLWE